MRTRSVLLLPVLAAACLAGWARPAGAYVGILPPTLGNLCRQATHISVLRVEKVSTEKGVILFKSVAQLKGKGAQSIPEDTLTKQVIGPDVSGARVILDWAAEGKTAVLFAKNFGIKAVAHVCIDGYWFLADWNVNRNYWAAVHGEPTMLLRYCGNADKLGEALARILRGEEVVVPAMMADNKEDLEQRRARVQELRASLQILGNPKQNVERDLKSDGKEPNTKKPEPGDKKPDGKTPGDKKVPGFNPDLVGTIKALAADGKSFTLLRPPTKKNPEASALDLQIAENAKIIEGGAAGKLAVGQAVSVWLQKGSPNIARALHIGKPAENPEKKPEPKKPAPDDKKKPAPDTPEKKPEAPPKPREPAKPVRDPGPTAAVIDAEVDRQLVSLKVPASPPADDAEFLRRVTLDLAGRIPTYQQTVAFLDSKDADKRRQLIDQLLDNPEHGEHLGAIWLNLLVGRELNVTGKGGGGNDSLRPWLAEQFNNNRGWNAIVTDLLTAEGTARDNPATVFLLANTENGRPQPNKAAGTAAGLFLGVNLRCAECHNHPFAHWKQTDFWGTAAFFGKVQYGGGKSGPPSLAESLVAGSGSTKEKGGPAAPKVRGAAIVIPAGSGKAAGQVVKARFLGGDEPALDEQEPFRPRFAAWATAADNPYFARAAVNRTWAHFFGRGFINPLDSLDTAEPSHPELLDRLAKEFTASGFDLKHLARCIATSKAYQRSSRPVSGNEIDTSFSHMTIKVLTPEVLYEALAVIGKDSGNARGKSSGEKQESREQFLRSFRIDEDASPTEYIQGIPQLLRLMNTSSPNRGAAMVEKLCSSGVSRAEAIVTLYLTVLSRRPSAEEVELMSGYLARRKDDREGYRGVLWILLNSSEFALNH